MLRGQQEPDTRAEEQGEQSRPRTSTCCDGFRVGGRRDGQVPQCLEPHKRCGTENKSLKAREWQHTQKPEHRVSVSAPPPPGLRQKMGFLFLWQKILLPGDTLAWDRCVGCPALLTMPGACGWGHGLPSTPLLCLPPPPGGLYTVNFNLTSINKTKCLFTPKNSNTGSFTYEGQSIYTQQGVAGL